MKDLAKFHQRLEWKNSSCSDSRCIHEDNLRPRRKPKIEFQYSRIFADSSSVFSEEKFFIRHLFTVTTETLVSIECIQSINKL